VRCYLTELLGRTGLKTRRDTTVTKVPPEITALFLRTCNRGVKLTKLTTSTHPCNENQIGALFIPSLFRQSTSTCFGHICSPSSGGILYIQQLVRVVHTV